MHCDLLIYGGTAAGVVAARVAALAGRRVVLVEPGRHLGGMSSGGLGYCDVGETEVIGGTARLFYRRIGDVLEETLGRRDFVAQGASRPADDGAVFTYGPDVACRVVASFVADADATGNPRVLTEHRITHAAVEDGVIRKVWLAPSPAGVLNEPLAAEDEAFAVEAAAYLDCSYEGDLLAASGCAFRVGREANTLHAETCNGLALAHKHQFQVPVDPYRVAGDAGSGLLPFVSDEQVGDVGAGDAAVQAYTFRLCLTQDSASSVPIGPPPAWLGYDPQDYTLLCRYVQALQDDGRDVPLAQQGYETGFLKIDVLPGGVTDVNNANAVSSDFIGQNHGFPLAGFATRGAIWRAHARWVWGLLHTLGNDPRLPASLRGEMRSWGFSRTAFGDTLHFPQQLYVREARRLEARLMMTEAHCVAREAVDDPVALAAYAMDSHNCRRLVVDGSVINEGDVQVPPARAFGVSYQSMVPASPGPENLLVPVCLGATHIAYGSIRMEPVFMALAESAALAAVWALDHAVRLVDVPYDALRPALERAGQRLTSPPKPQPQPEAAPAVVPVSTDGLQGRRPSGRPTDQLSALKFEGASASAAAPLSHSIPVHVGGVRHEQVL